MLREQAAVPTTDTNVYQAIYNRRMAWKYKDDPVPREVLDRMLDAAVWAPNHRLTEPWRFLVTARGSQARRTVADLAYNFSMGRNNNASLAETMKQSVLDPPYVVYVYSVPGRHDEETQENYAASICAAYIISLVGAAEGVAVTWETGGPTRPPTLKEALGAEPEWQLASMLTIGVPDEKPDSTRKPASEFIRWLD